MLKPIVFGTALLFALPILHARAQTLTASAAIQKIQHRYPSSGGATTVDTIKAGDPSTPVKGIATTFLDTMDVLREANRRGLNLVLTHEPTFYNHPDDTSIFKDDPVYLEKRAFIEQHHMVVFRLHDSVHDASPDPVALGLMTALGWQKDIQPNDPFFAAIPQTTLSALALHLEKTLGAPTMRVIGNPNLPITHVAILPGAAGLQKHLNALRRKDVDVLIIGEVPEWETVEYVRDAAAQGRHKSLILLGHEKSEEPGVELYTQQLRAIFPGIRMEHIVAGSPTWNPDHPPANAGPKPAQ